MRCVSDGGWGARGRGAGESLGRDKEEGSEGRYGLEDRASLGVCVWGGVL